MLDFYHSPDDQVAMVRIGTGRIRMGSPVSRYLVLARTGPERMAAAPSDKKQLYPTSGLLDFIRPLNGMVAVFLECSSPWVAHGPDHVVAMVYLGEFR